jgi:CRP-like cAMP-binding protein
MQESRPIATPPARGPAWSGTTRLDLRRNVSLAGFGVLPGTTWNVLRGVLRDCRWLLDGRRQITNFLFPGDWFSVDAAVPSGGLETVTDALLVQATAGWQPEAVFEGQLPQEVLLRAALARAERRIVGLVHRTAWERVITFLLDVSDRLSGGSHDVDLPMSRNDIADYLGLSSETVCRTVSMLQASGLIDCASPHHVRIIDRRRLDEAAATLRRHAVGAHDQKS